jgi:hypothetical protein
MTESSPADDRAERPSPSEGAAGDRFAGLAERPVTEHVEVFEAEHSRLQRELGSIDQV